MMLKDFNETYAHRLRDPEYLNAYLAACLEDGPATFYVGIRKAVQAREDGFTWLSHQTGIGREGLYKALSSRGNPSFRTVFKVLRALGVSEFLVSRAPENDPSASRETHRDARQGSENLAALAEKDLATI